MKRFPLASFWLLALLGIGLLGGVAYLFQLRFGAGDIYPEYSSLRADPKGTRVLFESLDQIPEVSAVRNLRPLHRTEGTPETTVLINGVSRRFSDARVEEVERLLDEGARVVISYYPFQENDDLRLPRLRQREPTEEDGRPSNIEAEDEVEDVEATEYAMNLGRAFDFGLRFKNGPDEKVGEPLEGVKAEDADWQSGRKPEFWFSRLYLEPGDEWDVLLRVRDEPVLIERDVSQGVLVVVTDSYWQSNEAMSLTRQTGFVTWLLASPRTVIFEETHLGVGDQERLSHLIREMNLEITFGLAVVLALLFIWKNGVAFPPREVGADSSTENSRTGGGGQAGLVNLLRANIPGNQLLTVCWNEWMKTVEPAERKRLAERISAGERVVKSDQGRGFKEQDLIERYQEVTKIINERKTVCKPRIPNSND